MKVKAGFVPRETRYFTQDEVYEVLRDNHNGSVEVRNDNDIVNCIRLVGCAHLNDKPWTVVEP